MDHRYGSHNRVVSVHERFYVATSFCGSINSFNQTRRTIHRDGYRRGERVAVRCVCWTTYAEHRWAIPILFVFLDRFLTPSDRLAQPVYEEIVHALNKKLAGMQSAQGNLHFT
jgi:hypothetical protein